MIVNGNNEQVPEIVMYDRKKGRVHKQSAVLAFDKQNNKIVAIGSDALAYTDGKNSNIEVNCPFQKGKIADFTVALSIFKYMVKEVVGKKSVFSSRNIAVCVPKSSTQVERKAYEEVAFMAGGKKVYVTDDPIETGKQNIPEMFDLIIGLSGEWGLEDDYKTEKSPSVIRIYTSDGTLILEELCLVARDESSKAIAAVGNEVKMAKESGATGLIYCEAVAERKIIDYPTAQIMFFYYIKKAEQLTKKHLRKPNVIVCNLPAELTQVDRKAYDDVLREAGALDVILSEMSSHELLQNGPLGEIQSQEEPGKKVKCRYIIEVGEENQ